MADDRVIIRGNNFEEYPTYEVGVFKRHGDFGIPVVEVDGKEYLTMGIVLPYSEALARLLDGMSGEEQWTWCKNLVQGREKYRQQNH